MSLSQFEMRIDNYFFGPGTTRVAGESDRLIDGKSAESARADERAR